MDPALSPLNILSPAGGDLRAIRRIAGTTPAKLSAHIYTHALFGDCVVRLY